MSTQTEPDTDAVEIKPAGPLRILAGQHLPYGTFSGFDTPFNFLDATIPLLPYGENADELRALSIIDSLSEDSCNADKHKKTLESVVREILSRETSFDLSNYTLSLSAMGARQSIISVLSGLVDSERKHVAYASPNWSFDDIVSHVPGAVCYPFFAASADQFVDSFCRMPNLDKLASVILVDPANPLGYRFSRDHIRTLEARAVKHGVVPLFDDVFRGMEVEGKRHSSSEHSDSSVIVETTSKRFGIRGLGVTWTLIPKNIRILTPASGFSCAGCSSVASAVTDLLYSTQYGEKVAKYLTVRSSAFEAGLVEGFPAALDMGNIVRGFDNMPFFSYFLPTRMKDAQSLHNSLMKFGGITSGVEWMSRLPEYEISPKEASLACSYIRVCPTKETPHRAYMGGKFIGRIIQDALKH